MSVVSVVVKDKDGNVVSSSASFNPALHPDGTHGGLCLYPAADFNPALPASGRPYTLKTTPPDYRDVGDHPGAGNVSRFHVLDVTGGGGIVAAAAPARPKKSPAKPKKSKAKASARKTKSSARTAKGTARKPAKSSRKPAKAKKTSRKSRRR